MAIALLKSQGTLAGCHHDLTWKDIQSRFKPPCRVRIVQRRHPRLGLSLGSPWDQQARVAPEKDDCPLPGVQPAALPAGSRSERMSSIIPFSYEGSTIQFNVDGWVNATSIAARVGRRLDKWLATQETQEYIKVLMRHLNTPEKGDLIQAQCGRGGGTWLHPKLAVAFARWFSPDFAVWCDLHIDALLHGDISIRQRFDQACRRERGSERQRQATGALALPETGPRAPSRSLARAVADDARAGDRKVVMLTDAAFIFALRRHIQCREWPPRRSSSRSRLNLRGRLERMRFG